MIKATNIWIPFLVNYWVRRCNIEKYIKNDDDIHRIYDLFKNNSIDMCNCLLLKGEYNVNSNNDNDLTLQYDSQLIFKNLDAKPRLSWYEDFFKKMNNNYRFKFLLNYLDCYPKIDTLADIKMIQFACSVPNMANISLIPILDAHHLWLEKRHKEYNPFCKLKFNTTPFRNKINKIVWRGGLCPTFMSDCLGLLHLRKSILEKYLNNHRFDIGHVSSLYYTNISIPQKNTMTYNDMTGYKYILNIDGFGSSFDGTIWKLRSPSLVIWITDENNQFYWLQWYYPLLKPFVHYVPSSIDNLEKTYEWCEQNQNKCMEIIRNANCLIHSVLLHTITYHKVLFDTLNKMYIE